jgi:predicted enzyme related to lactoylglutathione lyase
MACRHVLTILAVADRVRAAAFYRDAFGWRQLVDAPPYAEFEMPGGMRLGVYERSGFAKNTGELPAQVPAGGLAATELYLHADDLDQAVARLEKAGARPLSPLTRRDWGDEAAYFADPDGNVIVVARPF